MPHLDLKTLSKLIAIEALVVEMLTIRYLADPDPIAAANAHRLVWRRALTETPLPFLGDDASLLSGEVADAVDQMIDAAAQRAARARESPAA
jgi:hypothetical protein